jgi:hypothetical protein
MDLASLFREYVKSRLPHIKTITGDIHILESIPHNPQVNYNRLKINNKIK